MIGNKTAEAAEAAFDRTRKRNAALDKVLGGDGWLADDQSNVDLGLNIMREEIGFFGPWEGAPYDFDQQTRDRLLAHVRQDAASAFAMARSAFREAHHARRISERLMLILVVSLILNAAILVMTW